jgi:hypothetical protein
MSHPVLEGKPNANHVRVPGSEIHVHNDYIIGHHHTVGHSFSITIHDKKQGNIVLK